MISYPRGLGGHGGDLFAVHRCVRFNHASSTSNFRGEAGRVANARLCGRGGDISLTAFLSATLAWGDIAVTDWNLRHEGYLLEFGLNEYVGRLPTDQWRRTLRGEFCKPIDPRPKQHKASPQPHILLDGRRLPDQARFTGPRYWNEF